MQARCEQREAYSGFDHTFDDTGLPRPQKTPLAQAVTVALLAGFASGPLFAQDGELEEITVTATKRAESVMDVPIAITAMSGQQIRDVNLDDVKDLIAFTPGVSGNSKDSFLDFVTFRGIRTNDFGNGGDPSASFYKNGLYQGRNGSAVTSLYDVERAEVLRGPQAFLFGRNSISGAINVITAKPSVDAADGYVEVDFGERGHAVIEGAANFPLSDNFALRVAGYHSEEDGYVTNLAGGPDLIWHDKDAIRVSGRYETDKWTVDFMIEHEDREQQGTVYRATGNGGTFNDVLTLLNDGVPMAFSTDGRTVNNDNSSGSEDGGPVTSFGLEINYDMEWATFTSMTGFKDHEYRYIEDYDASSLIIYHYTQDQEGDYFEQEFRLTSNTDGPLSWYAGVSFYEENIDTVFLGEQSEDVYCGAYWSVYYNYEYTNTCQGTWDYYNYLDYYNGNTYYADYVLNYYFGSDTWIPSTNGLMNDRNRIIGKYRGYSAYVDLSYEFSETFDVNLGVRYTWDEKEFSQENLPDSGGSLLANRLLTGYITPNGPLRDKQDWDEVNYRLVANWRPNDNTLIFGSLTTGYKPGGFGSFNIEPGDPTGDLFGRYVVDYAVDRPGDFEPETVTSYEVGYKGRLLDGRAQLGVNAFVYDYEDMQAIFQDPGSPRELVGNVGSIDGTGVEVDLNFAVSDILTVHVGGSWFDSEATNVQAFCDAGDRILGDFDACEGNSLPWAPEWTAFADIKAVFPAGDGEVFGNLSWTWEDDVRGGWTDPGSRVWPEGANIYQVIPGIDQTDIVVGYRTDTWTVAVYAENLFDKLWYDGNYEDTAEDDPYPEHTFGPSRPRTAGVRFTYEWGD